MKRKISYIKKNYKCDICWTRNNTFFLFPSLKQLFYHEDICRKEEEKEREKKERRKSCSQNKRRNIRSDRNRKRRRRRREGKGREVKEIEEEQRGMRRSEGELGEKV